MGAPEITSNYTAHHWYGLQQDGMRATETAVSRFLTCRPHLTLRHMPVLTINNASAATSDREVAEQYQITAMKVPIYSWVTMTLVVIQLRFSTAIRILWT